MSVSTNSNGAAPAEGLTAESLMRMWRDIQRTIPPPVRIDLYGHDLSGDMYELNRPAGERRFIVVPRARLHEIYWKLRNEDADVRLEPRYGQFPDDSTGKP